ncbi:hypothetical protein [Helicobacter saguini]|nr:hypothetical protein [Helicobacter saguini]
MDNNLFTARLMFISYDEIKNINKNSSIAHLKALYECQDFIAIDYNNKTLLNKNLAIKNFGYKNDFANIFILNKDSITNEYLESRKALYKSFITLKQERIESIAKEMERINNLSFKENLILESKDKSIKIIFLDSIESNISMSNLIHIYNNKIDIFTKDKSIIDIESLVKKYNLDSNILKSNNTRIFFYSQLLQGGIESNNELLFGNVDSNNKLTESKPIYYLQDSSSNIESNLDSKKPTQTLQVFLDSKVLTILNYSLLESSLNIKLESKSKEAKKILSKELDYCKAKASRNDKLDSIESTAMLCPILEDNEIKCIHGGIVKLQSNKGKPFKSNNKSMILESDLLNSQIIGCQNTILGVPTPCNLISLISPGARALKKYNDDYPIMQDLVAGNIFSDKGFPLIATPKPNTFKINSPKPTLDSKQNLDSIESSINLTKPKLEIITPFYALDEYYLTPSYYENRDINQSGFYNTFKQIDLDLNIDSNTTKSLNEIIESIYDIYDKKYFKHAIISIRIAYSIYEYILVMPKYIPKFIESKIDSKDLEYGYGDFIDLKRDYIRECDDKEINLNIQGKILLAPSNARVVRVVVY